MKKHILLLAIFCIALYSKNKAQSDDCFRLNLVFPVMMDAKITDAYTDGDSISLPYMKKCALSLLCDGQNLWKRTGDTYLASYDVVIYDKGKIIESIINIFFKRKVIWSFL